MILTLPRDVRAALMLRKIKKKSLLVDQLDCSVPEYFQRWVKSQPDKPCLVFEDEKWTFKNVNEMFCIHAF